MILVHVPGTPIAKGRPRIGLRGGRAMAFTPVKTVAYEGLIALAAQDIMAGRSLLDGAISIEVTATFPIPASWSKKRKAEARWHTGRPDGDNILKAAGDALNGVVWKDDSQVARAMIVKQYGDKPGLDIAVEELPD